MTKLRQSFIPRPFGTKQPFSYQTHSFNPKVKYGGGLISALKDLGIKAFKAWGPKLVDKGFDLIEKHVVPRVGEAYSKFRSRLKGKAESFSKEATKGMSKSVKPQAAKEIERQEGELLQQSKKRYARRSRGGQKKTKYPRLGYGKGRKGGRKGNNIEKYLSEIMS
jgi:hypothetical protein